MCEKKFHKQIAALISATLSELLFRAYWPAELLYLKTTISDASAAREGKT